MNQLGAFGRWQRLSGIKYFLDSGHVSILPDLHVQREVFATPAHNEVENVEQPLSHFTRAPVE
jgi:hypothetical protein